MADPRLHGEGTAGLELVSGDGAATCSIELPAQGQALGSLGISTDCLDFASILVIFDRQEDGVTWILDRAGTAQADQGNCELRQDTSPVVITPR